MSDTESFNPDLAENAALEHYEEMKNIWNTILLEFPKESHPISMYEYFFNTTFKPTNT